MTDKDIEKAIKEGFDKSEKDMPNLRFAMTDKWITEFEKKHKKMSMEGFIRFVDKARQEAIEEKIEKIKGMRDLKYPPNRFPDYDKGTMEAGVQESTHVRRLDNSDREKLKIYNDIINLLEEK